MAQARKRRKPVGRHLWRPRGDHAAQQAAQAVAEVAPDGADDDPVARAEEALAQLAERVLDLDGHGMRAARRGAPQMQGRRASPRATHDALFHAAHDIKGEAATFGYPCRRARRQPVPADRAHARHDAAFRWRWSTSMSMRCAPSFAKARGPTSPDRRRADQQAARGHRRIPGPREPGPAGFSRRHPRPSAGAGRSLLAGKLTDGSWVELLARPNIHARSPWRSLGLAARDPTSAYFGYAAARRCTSCGSSHRRHQFVAEHARLFARRLGGKAAQQHQQRLDVAERLLCAARQHALDHAALEPRRRRPARRRSRLRASPRPPRGTPDRSKPAARPCRRARGSRRRAGRAPAR